jgi:nitroreductase
VDAITAMETCRAMRYLRPEPVSDAVLRRLVYAATRAPSPGNSQGWDFVIARDLATRRRISAVLRPALLPVLPAADPSAPRSRRLMVDGVRHLAEHLGDVPAWIFVCGRPVYPPNAPSEAWIPSAVLPAAQNLIVAARALGLGTVFSAFHTLAEPELRKVLELPDEVRIGVTIPLGWPAGEFGPVARKPVDAVLHWEHW